MNTPPKNPIQQLIDDFEAGRIHARRLSDGALIQDLGELVVAILADDCVIGSRAKFDAARAEYLALRQRVPFSRILIPAHPQPDLAEMLR